MKKQTKSKSMDIKETTKHKMNADELQMFLHFKKRGFAVPSKKGKGSYNRQQFKRGVAQSKSKSKQDFCLSFKNLVCFIFYCGFWFEDSMRPGAFFFCFAVLV